MNVKQGKPSGSVVGNVVMPKGHPKNNRTRRSNKLSGDLEEYLTAQKRVKPQKTKEGSLTQNKAEVKLKEMIARFEQLELEAARLDDSGGAALEEYDEENLTIRNEDEHNLWSVFGSKAAKCRKAAMEMFARKRGRRLKHHYANFSAKAMSTFYACANEEEKVDLDHWTEVGRGVNRRFVPPSADEAKRKVRAEERKYRSTIDVLAGNVLETLFHEDEIESSSLPPDNWIDALIENGFSVQIGVPESTPRRARISRPKPLRRYRRRSARQRARRRRQDRDTRTLMIMPFNDDDWEDIQLPLWHEGRGLELDVLVENANQDEYFDTGYISSSSSSYDSYGMPRIKFYPTAKIGDLKAKVAAAAKKVNIAVADHVQRNAQIREECMRRAETEILRDCRAREKVDDSLSAKLAESVKFIPTAHVDTDPGFIRTLVTTSRKAFDFVRYKSSKERDMSIMEIMMSRAEDVIAFITAISGQSTIAGFLGTCALYIKTWNCKSFVLSIMKIADDWALREFVPSWYATSIEGDEPDITVESVTKVDPEKVQHGDSMFARFADWLKIVVLPGLRSSRDGLGEGLMEWRQIKNSEFFKKLSSLVSIMVTAGYARALEGKKHLDVAGFRLLDLKVWDIHKETGSFFECVVETLVFFGYQLDAVVSTGSMRALFSSDTETQEILKEWVVLTTTHELVNSGRFQELSLMGDAKYEIKDMAEYQYRLVQLKEKVHRIHRTERHPQLKRDLEYKLQRLALFEAQAIVEVNRSTIIRKPYVVCVQGASSVGKTVVCDILLRAIAASLGIKSDPEYRANVTEMDAFDSTIKGHTRIAILDDLGNAHPDKSQGNPLRRIIEWVNNSPRAALKAEASEKGKVFAHLDLIMITTNVEDLHAKVYSIEPASIMRRVDLYVEVKVRKSHANHLGSIDSAKYKEDPDAWELTASQIGIKRKKSGEQSDKWFMNRLAIDAPIHEVCKIAATEARKQRATQERVVKDITDLNVSAICQKHCCPMVVCKMCNPRFTDPQADEPDDPYMPIDADAFTPQWYIDIKNRYPEKMDFLVAAEQEILDLEEKARESGDRIVRGKMMKDAREHALAVYADLKSTLDKKQRALFGTVATWDASFVPAASIADEAAAARDVLLLADELSGTQRFGQLLNNQGVLFVMALFAYVDMLRRKFVVFYQPYKTTAYQILHRQRQFFRFRIERLLHDYTRNRNAYCDMEDLLNENLRDASPADIDDDRQHVHTFLKHIEDAKYDVARNMLKAAFGVSAAVAILGLWMYGRKQDKVDAERTIEGSTVLVHHPILNRSVVAPTVCAVFDGKEHEIKREYLPPGKMLDPELEKVKAKDFKWTSEPPLTQEEIEELKIAYVQHKGTTWIADQAFREEHNTADEIRQLHADYEERIKKLKEELEQRGVYDPANPPQAKTFHTTGAVQSVMDEFTIDEIEAARRTFLPRKSVFEYQLGPEVPNPWKPVKFSPLPDPGHNAGATPEQLSDFLHSRSARISFPGTDVWCNAVPLTGSLWIVPRHFMNNNNDYHISLIRVSEPDKEHVGAITKRCIFSFADLDFSVVYIPFAGEVARLYDKMFDDIYRGTELGIYSTVRRDGTRLKCKVSAGPIRTETVPIKVPFGGKYSHSVTGHVFNIGETEQLGFCMGQLVNHSKNPGLVAFQLAGGNEPNPTQALVQLVSKKMFRPALEYFLELGVSMASEGKIRTSILGQTFSIKSKIHPKHCANYLRNEQVGPRVSPPLVKIYGAVTEKRTAFRSNIKISPYSELVEEYMDLPRLHDKPNASQPWRHYQRDLQLGATGNNDINLDIVFDVRDELRDDILNIIPKSELQKAVFPMSIDHAITGVDGVEGLDRMPFGTSAGFPTNGAKVIYAEMMKELEGVTDPKTLNKVVKDEVAKIVACYQRGEKFNPIFKAHMKDEAKPIGSEKVRTFEGAPVAFAVLMRQYFLPILRVIQRHNIKIGNAVGVNCHNRQWSKLAKRLKKFGNGKFVAGDFKAYDKKMPVAINRASFQILIDIAKASGNYTAEDLLIMEGIATDVCLPLIEWDTVLIGFFQLTASGHNGTVHINGLDNMILMRYAFEVLRRIYAPDEKFRFLDVAWLLVYGDDNNMAVSNKVPWYNFETIRRVLHGIGLTYTLPDKSDRSVKYLLFEQLDFLKRNYVWNEELGRYLAPLEIGSISKSLHTYNSLSKIDPTKLFLDNLHGALREFFHHGRAEYEMRVEQVKRLVKAANLEIAFGDTLGWEQMNQLMLWEDLLPSRDDAKLEQAPVSNRCEHTQSTVQDEPAIDMLEGGEVPITSTQTFHPAASEITEAQLLDQRMQSTIFTLEDVAPGFSTSVESQPDSTYGILDDSDVSLESFFRRPIKTRQFSWNVGTTLDTTWTPWLDYLNTPAVMAKTRNYRWFRGDLHVKFVVTSTQHHYGLTYVMYNPYGQLNDCNVDQYVGNKMRLTQISQRQKIMLDASTAQGGEIICPFFWHYDFLDLNNLGADAYNIGTITMLSVCELRDVLGGITSCDISVYSWFENVSIQVPTKFYPTANEPGVISKKATALARIAGSLSKVPTIGPYATATQIGLKAIGSIASIFGFSRPSDLHEPTRMLHLPVGDYSTVNTRDSAIMLTYDAKQETMIDPRIVGLAGKDDMAYANVLTIESFLTKVPFTASQDQDLVLFKAPICPMMYNTEPIGDANYPAYSMSAAAYVGRTKSFWRGSFRLRIHVNSSLYHRGKLLIQFDPQENIEDGNGERENTAYSYTIDIQERRDFTVCVGWLSNKPFLKMPAIYPDEPYGVTAGLTNAEWELPEAWKGCTNGTITIRVAAPLTYSGASPVDQPVELVLSTSMCDDTEYAVPSHQFAGPDIQLWYPTAVEEVPTENAEFAPNSNMEEAIMVSTGTTQPVSALLFGEAIGSIRADIKRYTHKYTESMPRNATTPLGMFKYFITHQRFLGRPGRMPDTTGSLSPLVGGGQYNLTSMDFLSYYMPCFVAYRGSTRYKIIKTGSDASFGTGLGDSMSVARLPARAFDGIDAPVNTTKEYIRLTPTTANTAGASYWAKTYYTYLCDGAVLTQQRIRDVLEFVLPWQAKERFGLAFQFWRPEGDRFGDYFLTDDSFMISGMVNSQNVSEYSGLDIHMAAGEDFALYRWNGPPIWYSQPYQRTAFSNAPEWIDVTSQFA